MNGDLEIFTDVGYIVGDVDLVPMIVDPGPVWDADILKKFNETGFEMEINFKLPADPWSNAELARLLHPRINRRVVTSTITPNIEDTALMGFADFYQDGWYARGIVRKLPSGNVEVMWTTGWTNMREGYQY